MQLRDTLAQRTFYFLTHERMSVIEDVADEVDAARVDWEHLIIRFDAQLQARKIVAHLVEYVMQFCLRRSENDNVVCIPKVILHFQRLFHIMVEIRQI